VRRINVTGNTKSRDEVVRREMRQLEGAWYSGEKLQLSKQRIDKLGYFTEVTGLSVEYEVFEWQEGGQNTYVHKLRGRAKYPNIVLKRGITHESALLDWFREHTASVVVTTDDGSLGIPGLVTDPLRAMLAGGDRERLHLYVCGPSPMLKAVAKMALASEVVCDLSLEAPIRRVTAHDVPFVGFARERANLPDMARIVDACRETLSF